LRELGELHDADIVVDPAELVFDGASEQVIADDKAVARNVEVVKAWATNEQTGKSRRIHLHFLSRPVELRGDTRVREVVVERTELDGLGGAKGTGETFVIPADLVVRSVGYRGLALPGVPFDEGRSVIPHENGRVQLDGVAVSGEYVAGWIKRGPTGIIGTNKKDAAATVASLLADCDKLPIAPMSSAGDFDLWLAESGKQVVDNLGWRSIDSAERALGARKDRDRTTIQSTEDLLKAAQPSHG
jgi:ferredoxin--NADP+ reductase